MTLDPVARAIRPVALPPVVGDAPRVIATRHASVLGAQLEHSPEGTPSLAGHAPIDLAVARSLVAGQLPALAPRALPLAGAHGCVLAADVRALRPVPAFDNSAMDGYAVRCASLERAGRGAWRLPAATAVPICTGQPIPDGMDAVVPLEVVRPLGPVLEITTPVQVGDHIRLAGEELAAGDLALPAGTRLSPAALGLLSLLGYARAMVIPKPKVGVLVTGDEVIAPGTALKTGQTYDANGPLLRALVVEAGGRVVAFERLRDDRTRIAETVQRLATRCDLVCTSGGASVGARDHATAVLAAHGRILVRELAIKPGRPTTVALVGETPVFALPGNPFALQAGFEAIVRPALARLAGRPDLDRERATARAVARIAHRAGRVEYVPVAVTASPDGLAARPIERRGSAMLSGLASSGWVAVLPADGVAVEVGGSIRIECWAPVNFADACYTPRSDGPEAASGHGG